MNKYGSDGQHPVFLPVLNTPCYAPELTHTPVGNQLSGSHCDSLSFTFEADPGSEGSIPATIEEWSVTAGIGTISASGQYLVSPQPPGTYPVTIEVTNSCDGYATYSFDVIFSNDDPELTSCRNNCGIGARFRTPTGHTFSLPLMLVDEDTCDDVSLAITGIEILEGDTLDGDLYLDGDVLVISPVSSDDGVALCVEVTADDGIGGVTVCEVGYEIGPVECGNANHLESVDIDDLVFLINYIFTGGQSPEPYHIGDVNCSTEIDIDDVVYIIAYIFTGGNAPCDTDGDGIPDC